MATFVGCAGLLSTLTGCQSMATQRQDRAIAEFAKDSGFPSPSDVGFVDDETAVASRDPATAVR